MSDGQQGEPVAYNLRSKSKFTGVPAVTSASGPEPTAATTKARGDLQKAEVKSEVGIGRYDSVC